MKSSKLLSRLVAAFCAVAMLLIYVPHGSFAEEEASSGQSESAAPKEEKREEEKHEPKQEEAAPQVTEAPKVTEAPADETPVVTAAPEPAEEVVTAAPEPTEEVVTPEPETTQEPAVTPEPTHQDGESTPAATEPTPVSTDEITPLPTDTPEPTIEPGDTTLHVSTKASCQYGVVGSKSISFKLSLSGGVAPYKVSITISNGGTVYSTDEWKDSVSITPSSFGTHTLRVTVTDALGNSDSDSASVPVAVNERESEEDWKRTLPQLTEGMTRAERLLAVARSQLGYKESKRNFIIDDLGKVAGYTRYGHWYGATYAEWCAMFCCFCLYYADIPEEVMPRNSTCSEWVMLLGENYLPKTYVPVAGDIIFFHHDREGSSKSPTHANHVGIVTGVIGDTVYTIEGNSAKSVREKSYPLTESSIIGYAHLPEEAAPKKNIFFLTDDEGTLLKMDGKAEAIPYDGYVFAYWTRESGEVVGIEPVLSTDASGVYTAHYVQQGADVQKIVFRAIDELGMKYEPAASYAEEVVPAPTIEEIEGLPPTEYKATEGGSVVVIGTGAAATAMDGYSFVNWTDAQGNVLTEKPVLIPSERGVTYTANFAPNGEAVPVPRSVQSPAEVEPIEGPGAVVEAEDEVVIELDDADYETVAAPSEFLADLGGSVTLVGDGAVAVPEEGFRFLNWTDANGTVISEEPTLVPSITGIYTAHFIESAEADDQPVIVIEDEPVPVEEKTFEFKPGQGGIVRVIGDSAAAVAEEGYRFVHWTDEQGSVVSEASVLKPEISGIYKTVFESLPKETTQADPIEEESRESVPMPAPTEKPEPTAKPDPSEETRAKAAGDKDELTIDVQAESTAEPEDKPAIEPEAKEIFCKFFADEGGWIRVIGKGAVAIEDEGYNFRAWINENGDIVKDGKVLIPDVSGSYTATFAVLYQAPKAVYANDGADEDGVILQAEEEPELTVEDGIIKAIGRVTEDGIEWIGWEDEEGNFVTDISELIPKDTNIEMPEIPDAAADEVVEAAYEESEAPSQFLASEGGSVTVDNEGALAAPDAGFRFLNWTNGQDDVVSSQAYLVPEITDVYTAHFEAVPVPKLKVSAVDVNSVPPQFLAGPGGHVVVIGRGAVAVADEGFRFDHWTGDANEPLTDSAKLVPQTVGVYTANFTAIG